MLRREGDWYEMHDAEPMEAARALYAEQARLPDDLT
ncbi:hypothetical protein HNP84_003967 [Thermocatellispora tengchongensis]|uniref:Uncharacterized protein n=1 Tax=Thermocatellispora tengchongensis TaxID=1073253 RepID=A0A840P8R3_9ACTN|nr:hypothetical protein [Thermocatellispora tengchongensis]